MKKKLISRVAAVTMVGVIGQSAAVQMASAAYIPSYNPNGIAVQSANSQVQTANETVSQSVKLSGAGKTKGMKATIKNGTVTLKWKGNAKISKYKIRVSKTRKFSAKNTTNYTKKVASITIKKAPEVSYVQLKSYHKKTGKWSKWGKTIQLKVTTTEKKMTTENPDITQPNVTSGSAGGNTTQPSAAPGSTGGSTTQPSATPDPSGTASDHTDSTVIYSASAAGVYIKTVENTAVSIRLELTNDTASMISFGEGYGIQKLENGVWVNVSPKRELVIPDIARIVRAGETTFLSCNWEKDFGILQAGQYRFVKEYWISGNGYRIASEFTI